MHRNTYVEINLSSIYHNIKKVMEISPSYHYYFGVVKADGYGHGVEIVETLLQAGINYLAVATLDEALEIRKDFLVIISFIVNVATVNKSFIFNFIPF